MMTFQPLHPKEFRQQTGLSVAQISMLSGVPIETLKCWFSSEHSKRKATPPDYICNYFGLLKQMM
ncbi:hypothetical protein IQ264_28640 [Phormidium sp. LEGE 05292]|uniref:hypothetical protein n=1 Tax=[Phormidium] sp. LEGE 05292 TaxID=767427 RepID=UPI00188227A8|nr:hypothetical protein [Phormidium sp. LEGE 05292]MBE9229377.1 hypothetical protein [Phormidium sp. LEGE 05292]